MGPRRNRPPTRAGLDGSPSTRTCGTYRPSNSSLSTTHLPPTPRRYETHVARASQPVAPMQQTRLCTASYGTPVEQVEHGFPHGPAPWVGVAVGEPHHLGVGPQGEAGE